MLVGGSGAPKLHEWNGTAKAGSRFIRFVQISTMGQRKLLRDTEFVASKYGSLRARSWNTTPWPKISVPRKCRKQAVREDYGLGKVFNEDAEVISKKPNKDVTAEENEISKGA